MSILYDDEQVAIADASRRVLDARTDKSRLLALLERKGEHDELFQATAIEQGWTALAVPEEHGGLGLGLVELGLVAQASGAATAGAPFLTGNYGAICALLKSGNSALQAQWLPRIASGEAVAAIAFAEGEILPKAPRTELSDGGLFGVKTGVTAGLRADFAVVWANHQGQQALVLADISRISRKAIDSFDNSRLFADLAFSDTPATVLADGPSARAAALDVLARMAVVTAYEQLGGAEALLFAARDYANSRRAFGQPIGAFQSVKHRIAELYGLVEIARANCIHAAAVVGETEFLQAAGAARLAAIEAYSTAVRDTMQIHGGIGVTWEGGLHLHTRRARSLAIEQGSTFFWEDVIAAELSGEAA